ncbi:hypothetical protein CTA1_5669 [Colletotrichum tanaceti]|uniref:Uncharacterized protein n=1 Tax=Colletotrichum tanaceti TaxID=1306861 RepID=A0A4U6WZF2_9PEZI|nr:hypothetical protein CTA1_5669 [Colletotrichum tanaceti]
MARQRVFVASDGNEKRTDTRPVNSSNNNNTTFEYRTAQCTQPESREMPNVITTVTSQQSRRPPPPLSNLVSQNAAPNEDDGGR